MLNKTIIATINGVTMRGTIVNVMTNPGGVVLYHAMWRPGFGDWMPREWFNVVEEDD